MLIKSKNLMSGMGELSIAGSVMSANVPSGSYRSQSRCSFYGEKK